MSQLWDMHVHLDFMRDPRAVVREAAALGLSLFAVTVTPAGYEQTSELVADESNVRVGVGLHPWWVADGRCGEPEVARAEELVAQARFVGEIGLDCSPRHVPEGSFDSQVAALETIGRACAETSDASEPKLLSLHAVRAAGIALDVLERTGALATCRCVFHWFSGSSDELHRAVTSGCWFSVNEMMLRTKRGREYARQLPLDRLLLETDLPPGQDVPFSAQELIASLKRTAGQLARIRGTDARTILSITAENSDRLC